MIHTGKIVPVIQSCRRAEYQMFPFIIEFPSINIDWSYFLYFFSI